jgi:hypothetical protein
MDVGWAIPFEEKELGLRPNIINPPFFRDSG